MNIEDILIDFVKEKGIVKIIMEIKKHMEYREYIDKFNSNWEQISNQKLSLDFIRMHKDKLNWYFIQMYINLTDKEIIEFQDHIKFDEFCPNSTNTPNVIKMFEDKINWDFVFSHLDNLTDDMIIAFCHHFQPFLRFHFVYGIPIEYVTRVKELLNQN